MIRATKASSLITRGVLQRRQLKPSPVHALNFGGTNYKHNGLHSLASAASHNGLPTSRTKDEDDDSRRLSSLPMIRSYHSTAPTERWAAIIMGLGAFSAACFAGAQGVQAYREWRENVEKNAPPPTTDEEQQEKASANDGQQQQQQQQNTEQQESSGPRENIFSKWFDVGGKYYEGGFEETMTKREAALILGVRETSTAQRIKEAHRKLLILNHPDTGGSTYMAGKINEAKELLLKGKKL